MIIPSIDIAGGKAVQLRQGRDLVLTDERDPVELAVMFGRFGPVAVVDLDAAFGRGANTEVIAAICQVAECRVGGGIRCADDVRNWIRRGAQKVVIGTMAHKEFLKQFPVEWLVVALDARGERVVTEGWRKDIGKSVLDQARLLEDSCSEYLFTQVEREGMLSGCDMEMASALREAVDIPITVAGGVTTTDEVVTLEGMGCNSQLGRAVYEGQLKLDDIWAAAVQFSSDGLVPTVVQDAASGAVLMLAYSNRDSLKRTLTSGEGWYYSRSRQELWRKGATSGNTQRLVAARWDCDRDTVLFRVEQSGPACHTGKRSCFETVCEQPLRVLESVLEGRRLSVDRSSYTCKLLDAPKLLAAKLREETDEVIEAEEVGHATWECADLLYHLMTAMQAKGVRLADVESELRCRFKP